MKNALPVPQSLSARLQKGKQVKKKKKCWRAVSFQRFTLTCRFWLRLNESQTHWDWDNNNF